MEKKQKQQGFGKTFFLFKIFKLLELYKKILILILKNASDKSSIILELRYNFVKILTYYIDFKHVVTMPSHQQYCLT